MFAIDYDGTIADTNAAKVEWIKMHLGIDVPRYYADRTSCVPIIGEEQYNKMSKEVYERESTLGTKPVPGATKAIKRLAEYGPVYVISARSRNQMMFAREWLKRCKLDLHVNDIVLQGNKDKITLAKALDCKVLIDDDERHLKGVPDANILLILLKTGMVQTKELGDRIRVCTSWENATLNAIQGL